MSPETLFFLTACILVVAFLYSSVGHAGASGYIAVMSLFNLAPAAIKPTALILNILVACIATWQFWRAGYFSWRLFWPFAALSVPMAFVGGWINLPTHVFKVQTVGTSQDCPQPRGSSPPSSSTRIRKSLASRRTGRIADPGRSARGFASHPSSVSGAQARAPGAVGG